jgi:hypothetical protein
MGIDSVLPDFRGPGGFWKVRALGPTGLLDSGHSLCISERRLSGKLLVGTVPKPVRGENRKPPFGERPRIWKAVISYALVISWTERRLFRVNHPTQAIIDRIVVS